MEKLPLIDEAEALGEVEQIFVDIRRTQGITFVPNLFKALANSPSVIRGTWDIFRQVVYQGKLPVALKQMIFVAISHARNCSYCEVAYLAFCKLLGVDIQNMTALVEDLEQLTPKRVRDIVKFSVKCALNPINVNEEDYETIRQHGVSDSELLEIMAMSAFSVYVNILADGLKLELDREFREILEG